MSKNIELDKFYTPKETAKKCIDIFNDTFKNATEIIEPSAGNGHFSLQIQMRIHSNWLSESNL